MAIVAGLIVLLLMTLGVVEVIGRSFFNKPIYGNLDIVEQLMIPVAALGVSYCQSKFGNVRMTLLTQSVEGRTKWLFESITFAVAAFVVFVYLRGSYLNLERSLTLGGDTPEIGIPLWIGISCVTASLALLLIRLVVQLAEALRLIITPDDNSEVFLASPQEQMKEE